MSATTDIVETYEQRDGLELEPLIVIEAIEPYVPGQGPIEVHRLGIGHSNETFRVSRGGQSWVLRRAPRPPFPPTAHDMVREFTVLSALVEHSVRAPHPVRICEDPEVTGAPFYLMEFVEGSVIRERFPADLDVDVERGRALDEFIDTLAEIHAVSWPGTPLEGIGRPAGYLERQLRRWNGQWDHNRTRPIADIDRVAAWLTEHIPSQSETTLVHGDYKLDNAIFHPGRPARLAVVVDWEMATLGDPLADVGLLCATYVERGEHPDEVLGFSPATTAPGCPSRRDLVQRYALKSGRSVRDLHWYEALALWKIAILLEGSYKRHLAGTTSDPFFALLADGVPRLAARAAEYTNPGKIDP